MQNTAGSSEQTKSLLSTAISMKDTYGLGVFYDGIYPKLIRATVSLFNYINSYRNIVSSMNINFYL